MSDRIAFRLKEEDFSKEELDKKADKLGINRTELIKKAIEVILQLDPVFIKNIDVIAERANVDFADVIKGFAVRRVAEIDARREVFGSSTVLKELQTTDQGSLDSNELYKLLKDEFIFRLEREKTKTVSVNDPLSKEQKDELTFNLIKKERKGKILNEAQAEFVNNWLEEERKRRENHDIMKKHGVEEKELKAAEEQTAEWE